MAGDRESIAAAASERVRAIVEAAEASAAAIRQEAEDDVRELRARVQDARERLQAVHAELDAIAASLAEHEHEPEPEAEAELEPAPEPEPISPPPAEEPVLHDDLPSDAEGARLVALEMALSGTSREETERHIADQFPSLHDPGDLLDEVYASVAS